MTRTTTRGRWPRDWHFHPATPTAAAVVLALAGGVLSYSVVAEALWREQGLGLSRLSDVMAADGTATAIGGERRDFDTFRYVETAGRAIALEEDVGLCTERLLESAVAFLGGATAEALPAAAERMCRQQGLVTLRLDEPVGYLALRPAFDGDDRFVGARLFFQRLGPRPTAASVIEEPRGLFLILLLAWIAGAFAFHWSYTARRRIDTLSRAAAIDGLTQTLRRESFFEELAYAILQARVRALPLSVLVIDVDRLKATNDGFGHAVGDILLRTIADAVRNNVRSGDKVGRLGGDEFAALMLGSPIDRAAEAAERIRERVEAACGTLGGHPVDGTVSIGVAQLGPGDGAEALVARADLNLYTAKRANRNRVVVIG